MGPGDIRHALLLCSRPRIGRQAEQLRAEERWWWEKEREKEAAIAQREKAEEMARPGRESRQEVGARRRMEAAWQVAEDHLRLLVEDANDEAIFTTDPVDLLRPGLA